MSVGLGTGSRRGTACFEDHRGTVEECGFNLMFLRSLLGNSHMLTQFPSRGYATRESCSFRDDQIKQRTDHVLLP